MTSLGFEISVKFNPCLIFKFRRCFVYICVWLSGNSKSMFYWRIKKNVSLFSLSYLNAYAVLTPLLIYNRTDCKNRMVASINAQKFRSFRYFYSFCLEFHARKIAKKNSFTLCRREREKEEGKRGREWFSMQNHANKLKY